jgi:protein disulfide-isomerase A1
MEATENDIPPSAGVRVSGFPTIMFKKAGSREFIDYDGDRSLESFVAFVEEQAKNKLASKPITKNESAEHAHDGHLHEEL